MHPDHWPRTDAIGLGLTDRAQTLLRVLIERYIRDGQPVGSRALTRDSGLGLSAATVRNVMADLEDLGLLASPHTSAGRVPTALGFRVFVDRLITVKPLRMREVEQMKLAFNADEGSTESILQSASAMLSSLTHMAGLVMVPRQNALVFRHVEFLALSEQRVLVILVFNEHDVQNRVIMVDQDYSESQLREAANFLNARYAGRTLQEVRDELSGELLRDEGHLDSMAQMAARISRKTLQSIEAGEDYVLAGQTNLMDCADLSDLKKLRETLEALNQKRDVLKLLDQCLHTDGIQIYIGEESGFGVLEGCSVVAANYAVEEEPLGVLGVIGPTRMAYERIIPIVDVTARLVGAALNSRK